jgi:hypothetical protein
LAGHHRRGGRHRRRRENGEEDGEAELHAGLMFKGVLRRVVEKSALKEAQKKKKVVRKEKAMCFGDERRRAWRLLYIRGARYGSALPRGGRRSH